jgi:hypothetical protein
MTGTLWNYESFLKFDEHQKPIPSDSLVRTLSALWKGSPQVRVVEAPEPGKALRDVLNKMLEGSEFQSILHPLSIIDEGGFLKGSDNQEVVEFMLENAPRDSKISQIIFYDAHNQLQMMGDGIVRPYVKQETDRTKSGAY